MLASSQTILNGWLGLSSGGEKLRLFLPLIRTRENPGSAGACGCQRPSGFGVQGCRGGICAYLISALPVGAGKVPLAASWQHPALGLGPHPTVQSASSAGEGMRWEAQKPRLCSRPEASARLYEGPGTAHSAGGARGRAAATKDKDQDL